jgi:hypothetical protein
MSNGDNGDDLPMISPPSDTTQIELTPQKEVRVNAPEPRRSPSEPVPKAGEPLPKPQGRVSTPTSVPGSAPGPAPVKKPTELGVPAVKPPAAPAAPAARPSPDSSASRPAAPAVKAAPPPSAGGEDEDPEKLLREYAERQKTKLIRLEQQLSEFKKMTAERDALRGKVETLGKELLEAKRQLDVAAKSDEVIKDLQGKVDAAILSNSILSDDKEKLKKALAQQTDFLKKSEERAGQAEKGLAEAERRLAESETTLAEEGDARRAAEARVAAALEALQGDAKAPAPKPSADKALSEMATRPMKAAASETAPKAPEERQASKPPEAADAKSPPPSQRPPGRFSFLKK